jgi:hypothetical protein
VTISFGFILYCVCFKLYCDCFNLFCKVWVRVCVGFVIPGCFGNTYTCIYCVLCCMYCVFVLFRLCIFILICFVCTSVRTSATEWNSISVSRSSNNNNNNNNNNIFRGKMLPVSWASKDWIGLWGTLLSVCFRHYGKFTFRWKKMVYVERREIFTRTGRLCILLSNGISLVFSPLGGPM